MTLHKDANVIKPTGRDLPCELTLEQVSAGYRFIFCDIWGVLHNGESIFPAAVEALKAARSHGLPVILISNAPRTSAQVETDLLRMGMDGTAWDGIVTSGDVTRGHLSRLPGQLFHIGPDRHLVLYEGLDLQLVREDEATVAACTGLFNEVTDQPQDYAPLLARLRRKQILLLCANPDISVLHGTRKLWCAGAVAREYAAVGGTVEMLGKPFAPIYEAALQAAEKVSGTRLRLQDGLAIGDGVHTDIEGAKRNGMDALFIAGGLHAPDFGGDDGIDADSLRRFLQSHRIEPRAVLHRLH